MGDKINGKTVFIAVRHGSYDDDNNLSQRGKEQMMRVAQQVKEINVDDLPVVIICSTAPRAEQGGQIIAKELNVPGERTFFNECLWYDNHHYVDRREVKKLVDDNLREDAILLWISHLDLVPVIASHAAEVFGYDKRFDDSSYGSGWFITSEGIRSFP